MSVRSLIVLLLAALAAPLGACEAEVTRAILHLARHAPVGAEPAGGAPDVLDGPDSAPAADASHDGGGPDEPADVADTASPADVGLEDLPPEPPPPLAVVLPRRLALP